MVSNIQILGRSFNSVSEDDSDDEPALRFNQKKTNLESLKVPLSYARILIFLVNKHDCRKATEPTCVSCFGSPL